MTQSRDSRNRTFRVSRGRNNFFFFFRQLVVTSATTIKNEHHDDDVGRTNERTNGRVQICATRKIEADGKRNGGGKERKGENVPGLKRVRENEQKHIREYGRADELPPGRFHRSRCYPRRMTVRAGGRAIRGEGKGGGTVETWVEDMAEERTTDVAHYANVSRYVVQRKQTEPETPTPYTHHASRRHPLTSSPVA